MRSNIPFLPGWSEEQWRAEVQRLTALNEELKLSAERLAEELGDLSMQNSHFDHRLNELISENWDLKQSIGRIRYGRPVRSVEDRHTINILQTENQEVTKLLFLVTLILKLFLIIVTQYGRQTSVQMRSGAIYSRATIT